MDRYDARADLEKQLVIVKLRDREFRIKLLHHKDYIKKFIDKKWYEVIISIDVQGRIWVAIPFRWEYDPYKPRNVISLDINLKKVVVHNSGRIRRIDTRFIEAYSLKVQVEKLQKKYPRIWRYNKRILNRIRNLHRCSR